MNVLVRQLSRRHSEEQVQAAAARLEERRLLTTVTVQGEPCRELAHDFLVERLSSWIDGQEAGRRATLELLRGFAERRSHGDREPLDLRSCRRALADPELFDPLIEEATPGRVEQMRALEVAVRASYRHHLRWRAGYAAGILMLLAALGGLAKRRP